MKMPAKQNRVLHAPRRSALRRPLGGARHFTRRGAIVLLSVFMIGVSSLLVSAQFLEDVTDHYLAVRASADGFRSRELALAGFQASIAALKTIPEEFLYQKGIILKSGNQPDIELARHCLNDDESDCYYFMVGFRLQPEDGKLNLNNLVRYDDQPNESYREIIKRLLNHFKLSGENADAVVDWIDENDYTEAAGAEDDYYNGLEPPRKIKNFRMFSLSELAQIKGFDHETVYSSLAPEDWEEQQEELSFQTDDEKNLIQPEDFILANNVTAFMPFTEAAEDKVNINAARYFTVLSLSDAMTREAVMALFKLRRQNQGYIKNISELRDLPEFQVPGGIPDVTLYQELAGTGGDVSGMIKTEGEYYRVVGVGTIIRQSDNSDQDTRAVRLVWGIWDKSNRRLIYYSEG